MAVLLRLEYSYFMQIINFAASNKEKIQIAETVCGEFGVSVNPISLGVDEIQGENPVLIVEDKAKRAYEMLRKPVVVSDDTWDIPALNGFPGAYMKSINYWFEPEDFIRLMHGVDDRRIVLHQFVAYADDKQLKVFSNDIHG